jgi:hypothetical protein
MTSHLGSEASATTLHDMVWISLHQRLGGLTVAARYASLTLNATHIRFPVPLPLL